MKDLKLLSEKLKEFNDKDISIRFEGSLRLLMEINQAHCLVTKKVVLIGDSNFNELQEVEIAVDEISSITIDKDVILKMNGNYEIYISK